MLKIAVCDDDKEIVERLTNYINEYFNKQNIVYAIDTFFDGMDFMNYCNEINFNILFLDIELGKYNGVKIARILKKGKPDMFIVFVTSYHSFVKDAFRLKVFQYLEKPFSKEDVFHELKRILEEIDIMKKKFIVTYKGEKWSVPFKNIAYIESEGRYMFIHTKAKCYKMICKLDTAIENLDKSKFIRIHKSTIINLNFVVGIKGDDIVLKFNGKTILPISRSYKENVMQLFMHNLPA